MRIIGMDIHRVFAEVALLAEGKLRRLGRVEMQRDKLEAFARTKLTSDDHVVVEATGNAAALAEVLRPYVGQVVIANPIHRQEPMDPLPERTLASRPARAGQADRARQDQDRQDRRCHARQALCLRLSARGLGGR